MRLENGHLIGDDGKVILDDYQQAVLDRKRDRRVKVDQLHAYQQNPEAHGRTYTVLSDGAEQVDLFGDGTVADWRDVDPHLLAAEHALGRGLMDHEVIESLREDIEPRREAWLEKREEARRLVREWEEDRARDRREIAMMERVGEVVPDSLRISAERPVPEDLLVRASEPDLLDQFEAYRVDRIERQERLRRRVIRHDRPTSEENDYDAMQMFSPRRG